MKKIVISGTSSGIGLAMVKELAAKGHSIYAGIRSKDDFDKLETINNVTPVYLDVTDEELIAKLVQQLEIEGGVDVVINNAGIGIVGPLLEISLDQIKHQFDINIYGAIRMIQAFKSQLIDNKGHIINVSSLNGHRGSTFGAAYNMSKFAVEALSETLRNEVKKFGISISVLNPVQYKTPIFEKMKQSIADIAEETELYQEEYQQMSNYEWTEIGRDTEIIGKEILKLLEDQPPSYLSATEKERIWTYEGIIQRLENVVHHSEDETVDIIDMIKRIRELKNN